MRKIVALLIVHLMVTVHGYSQAITLQFKNITISEAMKKIERNTPFRFSFTGNFLYEGERVNFEVKNATIEQTVKKLLEGLGLKFEIDGRRISILKLDLDENKLILFKEVTVTDSKGTGIPGVSVEIDGTTVGITDSSGSFSLRNFREGSVLSLTAIGFKKIELKVYGAKPLIVEMEGASQSLEELLCSGYSLTSRRYATSAIAKVTADDIVKQPVDNPALTLYGRVPGLNISQASGQNGAAVNFQIRGKSSLGLPQDQATTKVPLFSINGVPFASDINIQSLIGSGSVSSGPLSIINPQDIESIEVLKDADATAIYGSRGAHGVILITTKKPAKARLQFDVNLYSGFRVITGYSDLLNTQQYFQMRMEAAANDGITLDPANAPDIFQAGNSRYTDLKKLLIGNYASVSNLHVNISGTKNKTSFLFSAGCSRDNMVFPGALSDTRVSIHSRINKFLFKETVELNVTALYADNKNQSLLRDLATETGFPPNIPLYDSSGALNWLHYRAAGNPAAYFSQPHISVSRFGLFNLLANIKLLKNLKAKINAAYNSFGRTETGLVPGYTLNPHAGSMPTGSSYFGYMNIAGSLLEPQLEYKNNFKNFTLSVLLGGTYHLVSKKQTSISATGFINDALLTDTSAAGEVSTNEQPSEYKYVSVFGRFGFLIKNRYVVNLNMRRDGSSRFGPSKPFGIFGSVAFGWIFSKTIFITERLPFISFGKLRGSWGITGSDQFGDFKYVESWSPVSRLYMGRAGLAPSQLSEPFLSWEETRKAGLGLELRFLKDFFSITIDVYQNLSRNLLLSDNVPLTSGFNFVAARNSGVRIKNSGLELTLEAKPIQKKKPDLVHQPVCNFSPHYPFRISRLAAIKICGSVCYWQISYAAAGIPFPGREPANRSVYV